ncbi:MAG: guanine nucleotide-binding protein subunit alpha [Watsoniomyces obsoletus]|nr:MAG: guanine nucleotide-binding protein subunit alpha [Watsoniomyces obsoletus]
MDNAEVTREWLSKTGETPRSGPSRRAGSGGEHSRTLEALKMSRKERLFHLRALDISITECELQLSRKTDQTAPEPARWQELRGRLDQALMTRQGMHLEVSFIEVEMELLLLRKLLAEERQTPLLPRCAACFVGAPGNNRSGVDSNRSVRPIRWDSLTAVDKALIPPPLRMVRTAVENPDQNRTANSSPKPMPVIEKTLPRYRSFKILVQRLKPQKSLKSSLSIVPSDVISQEQGGSIFSGG